MEARVSVKTRLQHVEHDLNGLVVSQTPEFGLVRCSPVARR